MKSDLISIAKRRMAVVGVVTMLGNAVGATVLFIYFRFIEAGLVRESGPGALGPQITLFVIWLVAVIALLSALGLRITASTRASLIQAVASGDKKSLSDAAARLLDVPTYMAGVTLLGWLISGILFSFAPPAYQVMHGGDWHSALRALVGTWLVATPLTAALIFFRLEWWMRDTVRVLIPPDALLTVPKAFRINVLPKMLFVSLLIGILPVAVMSYLTLSQIHLIDIDPQTIVRFLSRMPIAVVFLLVLTVINAVALSVAVAWSVSMPLWEAGQAMAKIGAGNLNVNVPVVSNDEIGLMSEGFNRMVEGLRERDLIRDTFGRYVSEEVAREVLKSPTSTDLGGKLRNVTILVADLRDFTRMTASIEPHLVLIVLNRFFGAMTDIILRYAGTIDEFTGDGILVFFGAPRNHPDDTARAVSCALEMQQAMNSLNERNEREGLPRLEMGIGINVGELIVGNIGSEERRKYGAVGSPINMAFRVEDQTCGGEILVTPAVHQQLADRLIVSSQRQVTLKGIDEPVTVYQVEGINP
ncbi:MAG: adenylate/guanylate cyclase domain-containing protein [Thermodesulfobacteriota bacterium]